MREKRLPSSSAIVIAAVVLINFLTMPAEEYHGDAQAVRMEAITILRDGHWAVPDAVARRFGPRGNYFYQTNDGAWYPKFGILNTVVYLPFLAFERAVKGNIRYGGDHVLVLNLLNILASAAAAFYLFRLAQRYTESRGTTVAFVFASIYGTFWWHYLRAHAFEAYMVPAVLGFFYHFLTNDPARPDPAVRRFLQNPMASGLFLGALCLIKTVFVIFVPIAFALLFYEKKRDEDRLRWWNELFWFGVPVLVCLGALAFSNSYRFGSIFNGGYTQWAEEKHLFGGNILTGLRGYLFGPQTSVFLHYPLLLLAVPFWPGFIRRHPADGWLAISLGAAFILVHAARENWSGAACYGPRYALPVAPLLALPFVNFIDWMRIPTRPAWRWTAAVAAGAVILLSLLLQVALNSLPFYFDQKLALTMDDANEGAAVDYLKDRPQAIIAVDFLLYARGRKSGLTRITNALSPDGFAQMEAAKANTRFNYYWHDRPVEAVTPIN